MIIYPTKKIFGRLKKKFNLIPIFAKLNSDEYPLSIYSKLRGKHSFILNSPMEDCDLGRYSFIGFEPFLTIKSKGRDIFLNGKHYKGNQIKILKKKLNFFKSIKNSRLPLFFGGAAGYFSYDIAHFFERLPKNAVDDMNIPDMYFLFINKSIIFDHLTNELFIVVLGNDYEKSLN